MKKICLTSLLSGLVFFSSAQSRLTEPLIEAPATNLSYFENRGQITDETDAIRNDVKYYTENFGRAIYLLEDRASFCYRQTNASGPDSLYRFDMQFKCPNWEYGPCGTISAYDSVETHLNYYLPHCADGIANVTGYDGVVYEDAFSNIDFHFYSNNSGPKGFIRFKPGSVPNTFVLQFTGQDSIRVIDSFLQIYSGSYSTLLPINDAYTVDNIGNITGVNWLPQWTNLGNGEVGLQVGAYNPTQNLIVRIGIPETPSSPEATGNLGWGTYYGQTDFDMEPVIHVTPNNVLYHAFTTTGGTFQSTPGKTAAFTPSGTDCYISRFNSNNSRLWGTYFGGVSDEVAYAITTVAPDGDSKTLILGGASSSSSGINWGSTGFTKTTVGGSSDGFIARFNEGTGEFDHGTLFGGGGDESILSLAADHSTSTLYFAGSTSSSTNATTCSAPSSVNNFPLCSGTGSRYFQSAYGGGASDGFVGALNTSNSTLTWSTYFGGNGDGEEEIRSIAVDNNASRNHAVYIGGITTTGPATTFNSPRQAPATAGTFPLANPGGSSYFQNTKSSTTPEGFAARFDQNHQLDWCTYFGGSSSDGVQQVAVGPFGDLYVAGFTQSSSPSTTNSSTANSSGLFPVFHPSTSYTQGFGGSTDNFLARFNNSRQLAWCSYFGGAGNEFQNITTQRHQLGLAVSGAGDVFIGGGSRTDGTNAGDMPVQASGIRYFQNQNASNGASNIDASSSDGYVAQFNASNVLVWGTHYGGHNNNSGSTPNSMEHITAIALGGSSNVDVYISGRTSCDQTPVKNPGTPAYFQGNFTTNGVVDNFIARLGNVSTVNVKKTVRRSSDYGKLSATPNPSTGIYTMDFTSSKQTNKDVQAVVVNSVGQTVYSTSVRMQGSAGKFIIDLMRYPAGVYVVSILGEDPISTRLIKE